MKRRQFVGRAAASALLSGIGRPSIVRAASATTLKFVPYADLALLDPLVSAFVTRNHVMMVFDTLFALDANGTAQYQMLAGHTIENDGKTWKPIDDGNWNALSLPFAVGPNGRIARLNPAALPHSMP